MAISHSNVKLPEGIHYIVTSFQDFAVAPGKMMGSPEDWTGPGTHHRCRRINHWVDQQTETGNIRNQWVSPCDHSVSSVISPSSKSIVILCHATLFSMLFHHITMIFPIIIIELKSQMLSYLYIYTKKKQHTWHFVIRYYHQSKLFQWWSSNGTRQDLPGAFASLRTSHWPGAPANPTGSWLVHGKKLNSEVAYPTYPLVFVP